MSRKLGIDEVRERWLPRPAPESDRLEIEPQNDRYSEPWHTRGCRALCLAAIAQIDTGYVIPSDKLEDMLLDMCLNERIVSCYNAATGIDEHQIINEAFALAKHPERSSRQVGVIRANGSDWNGDADHDYQIVQYPTSGEVGTHFVLCDADQHLLYDPWFGDDLITGPATAWLFYKVWR